MVVRRYKKIRKKRGERTHHGSHKKHRGGGSRGGRGKAGLHKHKWSYTVKYEPEHYGKRGFVRPAKVLKDISSINIKDIDRMADSLIKGKIAEREGGMIKINMNKLGYQKVLGNGKITKPLIIEANYFSKQAIEKIEKAGGKVVKI